VNYITLDKEYPIFFGGAAVRRLWQSINQKVLSGITKRIFKTTKSKLPEVTDSELFDVFIPLVKWGIWGGQRFEGENTSPILDDDLCDLLYPKNMEEGYKVLVFFLESQFNVSNGQAVSPVSEVEGVKKN